LWTMRNSLARRLTRRRRHTLPLGPLEKRKKNSARPAPPRRTATTRQGTYGLARDRCSSASCVHLGKYSVLLHHCSLRVVQKLHCPLLIHQVCPAFAVSWEILVTYWHTVVSWRWTVHWEESSVCGSNTSGPCPCICFWSGFQRMFYVSRFLVLEAWTTRIP
jgi:hypothetical protein